MHSTSFTLYHSFEKFLESNASEEGFVAEISTNADFTDIQVLAGFLRIVQTNKSQDVFQKLTQNILDTILNFSEMDEALFVEMKKVEKERIFIPKATKPESTTYLEHPEPEKNAIFVHSVSSPFKASRNPSQANL